jgi:glycosyltransferase involved in cell wall biosynthesis
LKVPKVSVAIATWNGERYLREQLDTIYGQTLRPFEVVVSDDASTDKTVEILKEYEREQGLRYVVNQKQKGLVKNFEQAISLCSGDFIALSDQDDIWKPHKLATLVEGIGEATLIYCNVNEVLDLDGQRRYEERFEPISHFARALGSGHPTRYLIAENWVVSHSILFRRELVGHALPIPVHQRFHDGWLALVASKLKGIVYLDETLQTYRRHPESYTFIPAQTAPTSRRWLRLLNGDFGANWRQRCASETARLSDVLSLSLLDANERRFISELLNYYRSGMEAGHRWRAFRSGVKVARFFSTQQGRMARLRMPLKAALASGAGLAENSASAPAQPGSEQASAASARLRRETSGR